MTKHQRRTAHGGAGVLACALALAASGCGGGGGSSTQDGAQASVTLADHLTLSLSEDKTSASVGDKVRYQITLTNPTAAPITSTYAGYGTLGTTLFALEQSYGLFSVKDSSGKIINEDGSFSSGPPPVPPPQSITFTLQPGQSLPLTRVYTFQPGVYTATAALQNADLSLTPAAGPLTVTVH
jgi:hypothetical protein